MGGLTRLPFEMALDRSRETQEVVAEVAGSDVPEVQELWGKLVKVEVNVAEAEALAQGDAVLTERACTGLALREGLGVKPGLRDLVDVAANALNAEGGDRALARHAVLGLLAKTEGPMADIAADLLREETRGSHQ